MFEKLVLYAALSTTQSISCHFRFNILVKKVSNYTEDVLHTALDSESQQMSASYQ